MESGAFGPFMADLAERCRRGNVPAVSEATGDFLALLVRLSGAREILEIGTAHGYSTLRLAEAAGPDGRIVSVEFSAPSYEAARVNVAASGYADRCELRAGNALAIVADLPGECRFDAAFVDGEKRRTSDFLALVWPRVRPGGWVVVDDVVKFRHKMDGLDAWLVENAVVPTVVRTDADDGVMVLLKR